MPGGYSTTFIVKSFRRHLQFIEMVCVVDYVDN